MTKTKVRTYWYDQWDKGQPRSPSTPCLPGPDCERTRSGRHRQACRPRRIAVTLAVWRKPHITPAHPSVPDLTVQFSRN
jgi:hypothetical protein